MWGGGRDNNIPCDSVDDGFEDAGDAVDDGGDCIADGAEDGFNLEWVGELVGGGCGWGRSWRRTQERTAPIFDMMW